MDFDNNNEIVKMTKVYILFMGSYSTFQGNMLINLNFDMTTILLYNII